MITTKVPVIKTLADKGDVFNLLTFDPITKIKFKSWERPHSHSPCKVN